MLNKQENPRNVPECQALSLGSVLHQRLVPILLLPSRFTICHKTEVVKNTLNPVWQPFSIPVRALCNGDYDRSASPEVREEGDKGMTGGFLGPRMMAEVEDPAQ